MRALARAALVLVLAAGAAHADPDLATTLVGTWQGRIPMPPVRESSRNIGARTDIGERSALYENRALTITSVKRVDGEWIARGRFGRASREGTPVTIHVTADGDTIRLRFPYGGDAEIDVTLVNGALEGSMSGKHPRAVRLERKP